MSVICPNCEGWTCSYCKHEREASKGGEQGLSPLEIEVEGLRAELATTRTSRDVLRALLVFYDAGRRHRCHWCGSAGEHETSCAAFHPSGGVKS